MNATPSAQEVIESCLIETTKIGRCNQAAENVVAYLKAAGYVIVPREPTEAMSDQIIFCDLPTIEDGNNLWRAMIDAALEHS